MGARAVGGSALTPARLLSTSPSSKPFHEGAADRVMQASLLGRRPAFWGPVQGARVKDESPAT